MHRDLARDAIYTDAECRFTLLPRDICGIVQSYDPHHRWGVLYVTSGADPDNHLYEFFSGPLGDAQCCEYSLYKASSDTWSNTAEKEKVSLWAGQHGVFASISIGSLDRSPFIWKETFRDVVISRTSSSARLFGEECEFISINNALVDRRKNEEVARLNHPSFEMAGSSKVLTDYAARRFVMGGRNGFLSRAVDAESETVKFAQFHYRGVREEPFVLDEHVTLGLSDPAAHFALYDSRSSRTTIVKQHEFTYSSLDPIRYKRCYDTITATFSTIHENTNVLAVQIFDMRVSNWVTRFRVGQLPPRSWQVQRYLTDFVSYAV